MKLRKLLTSGILIASLVLPVYAQNIQHEYEKVPSSYTINNTIAPNGYDDESIYVTKTYYASENNFPEKIWHQEVKNGKVYTGYLKFTHNFSCHGHYCSGTYSGNLYYAGPAY